MDRRSEEHSRLRASAISGSCRVRSHPPETRRSWSASTRAEPSLGRSGTGPHGPRSLARHDVADLLVECRRRLRARQWRRHRRVHRRLGPQLPGVGRLDVEHRSLHHRAARRDAVPDAARRPSLLRRDGPDRQQRLRRVRITPWCGTARPGATNSRSMPPAPATTAPTSTSPTNSRVGAPWSCGDPQRRRPLPGVGRRLEQRVRHSWNRRRLRPLDHPGL